MGAVCAACTDRGALERSWPAATRAADVPFLRDLVKALPKVTDSVTALTGTTGYDFAELRYEGQPSQKLHVLGGQPAVSPELAEGAKRDAMSEAIRRSID